MTYADCLSETFLNLPAWGLIGIGLLATFGLIRAKRYYTGLGVFLVSIVCAAFHVSVFYELNCVELLY